jgi:predicted molibdopterin-dependent oxidoreductase YjgC
MTEQTAGQVFTFDSSPIRFRDGQSVGAALTVAGVRSWRSTRIQGRPRGIFCGIGVCFDCLVVVDGQPNERACLVLARPGMTVETQEGTGHGALEV